MKLSWPSKLIFKFISNGEFASNLLVYFILLSELKNNFSIGPLLTDNFGEIKITHDIMNDVIGSSKADYPMDYDGTLENCTGIEVKVDSINELNSRINRLHKFYPEEATTLESLITKCSNSRYVGTKISYQLPIDDEVIEVKVGKI